jgi:hypothetical protein
MKKYLLTSFIFASFISTLIIVPSHSQEPFSKDQRQLVIETIDNTCADSWCEGDYNFEFTEFSCIKTNHVCELKFYFINTYNKIEKKSQLQLCHFANIFEIEQIIDKSQELNNHFYELLDACISERAGSINWF